MLAMKIFAFLCVSSLLVITQGKEDCPVLHPDCYSCIKGNILDENDCEICKCLPMTPGQDVWYKSTMYTSEQVQMLEEHGDIGSYQKGLAKASPPSILRWNNSLGPDGFYWIPYFFTKALLNNSKQVENIQRAISSIFSQTCVKFVPAKVGDTSIIRFANAKQKDACTYFLGRRKNTIRTIRGCNTVGKVLRAIMSAFGFFRESLRSDRDQYISFKRRNMIGGDKVRMALKLKSNITDITNSSFDYSSVTNFGPYEFSAHGRPTVYDNRTGKEFLLNEWALSSGDKRQIRKIFNCGNKRGVKKTKSCRSIVDYGAAYRGNMNVTESGTGCQMWSSQTPHEHSMTSSLLTGSDMEMNFCRNPDMKSRPWCFTTNNTNRWEYCNISICNQTEKKLPIPSLPSMEPYGWAEWGAWSACDKTCGPGWRQRKRFCITYEDNVTLSCPGNYYEGEHCEDEPICVFSDRWHVWQPWSASTKECGIGFRTRVRWCVGVVGLGDCVGNAFEVAPFNSGITCPLYPGGECFDRLNPSSYHGTINVDKYGRTCLNWTDTTTNTTEYPSINFVENHCRNPKGKRAGPVCHNTQNSRTRCNVTVCNSNANWNPWGSWSACSTSCAVEGTKTRVRVCSGGAGYGEGTCFGDVKETVLCNLTCIDPYVRALFVIPTTIPVLTTPPRLPDCIDPYRPREYRGRIAKTVSGAICQKWASRSPTVHNYTDEDLIARAGLSENYCRTPDEDDTFPWCYTVEFIPKKEKCFIPSCSFADTSVINLEVYGRPYQCVLYTENDDDDKDDY